MLSDGNEEEERESCPLNGALRGSTFKSFLVGAQLHSHMNIYACLNMSSTFPIRKMPISRLSGVFGGEVRGFVITQRLIRGDAYAVHAEISRKVAGFFLFGQSLAGCISWVWSTQTMCPLRSSIMLLQQPLYSTLSLLQVFPVAATAVQTPQ